MKRPYHNNKETDIVTTFIGTEVENSPMLGHKTLFIVGIQDVNKIIETAKDEDIEHVYLGANMSFLPQTEQDWQFWTATIDKLLDADLWVTLDYDRVFHENVLAMGHQSNPKFISMISLKLPHIDKLNGNACIKIDDKDFQHSNKGVWVHNLRNLQTPHTYTGWNEYTQDKPLDIDSK